MNSRYSDLPIFGAESYSEDPSISQTPSQKMDEEKVSLGICSSLVPASLAKPAVPLNSSQLIFSPSTFHTLLDSSLTSHLASSVEELLCRVPNSRVCTRVEEHPLYKALHDSKDLIVDTLEGYFIRSLKLQNRQKTKEVVERVEQQVEHNEFFEQRLRAVKTAVEKGVVEAKEAKMQRALGRAKRRKKEARKGAGLGGGAAENDAIEEYFDGVEREMESSKRTIVEHSIVLEQLKSEVKETFDKFDRKFGAKIRKLEHY